MSSVWHRVRRMRVPAPVREAARGRAGPQDLGAGATLGEWRAIAEGRAPRFGARELIGSGVTRVGGWRKVDPLRAPALPSKTDLLGVAIWASLIGYAGRKAWKQHGGVSGARADLRGEGGS